MSFGAHKTELLHFFKIAGVHGIELAAGGVVYHVEERGKGLAQVEAAPAAVAHVKHAPHFLMRKHGTNELRTRRLSAARTLSSAAGS